MFKVHTCDNWDLDGLTSTTVLFEGTRDQCWDFIATQTGHDQVLLSEYLVEKPTFSIGSHGWPSSWDEAPQRFQRM